MTKREKLLKVYKKHVGEWYCKECACKEIGEPVGHVSSEMRALRYEGYSFAKDKNKRNFGQVMYCDCCMEKTTHFKLLSENVENEDNSREVMSQKEKQTVRRIYNDIDAFTGCISLNADVDHKIPHTVQKETSRIEDMGDLEIKRKYQVLGDQNNHVKRGCCEFCKKTNIRPPYAGMGYYYAGNHKYEGTCYGCGYYDGIAFRKAILNGTAIKDEEFVNICLDSKNKEDTILCFENLKNFIYNERPDLIDETKYEKLGYKMCAEESLW